MFQGSSVSPVDVRKTSHFPQSPSESCRPQRLKGPSQLPRWRIQTLIANTRPWHGQPGLSCPGSQGESRKVTAAAFGWVLGPGPLQTTYPNPVCVCCPEERSQGPSSLLWGCTFPQTSLDQLAPATSPRRASHQLGCVQLCDSKCVHACQQLSPSVNHPAIRTSVPGGRGPSLLPALVFLLAGAIAPQVILVRRKINLTSMGNH